jgi:hypothetical protein
VRVSLAGIHKVRIKLAGGNVKFFYYAWRGGPRLVGEPGSPEFLASYMAAMLAAASRMAARFIPSSPVTRRARIFSG